MNLLGNSVRRAASMIDGRLVSEVTPKRKSAAEVNEFVELPQIEAREDRSAGCGDVSRNRCIERDEHAN
jgi:hypothetical protein